MVSIDYRSFRSQKLLTGLVIGRSDVKSPDIYLPDKFIRLVLVYIGI